MKIWTISLFPDFFLPLEKNGVVARAINNSENSVILEHLNLRDFSKNSYKGVDDRPFGGGPGMVIRADILEAAINSIFESSQKNPSSFRVILPTPSAPLWTNKTARAMASDQRDLIFICGRYEGIDQRFIDQYVTDVYCLGDFILSGGEIAALAMIDGLMRFVPECLGNSDSSKEESFEDGLLEGPQYTRPRVFNGVLVPEVYLSGDHKKIEAHKFQEKINITKKYRPDLWEAYYDS